LRGKKKYLIAKPDVYPEGELEGKVKKVLKVPNQDREGRKTRQGGGTEIERTATI